MDALLKMEADPIAHIVSRSCQIKASVVMEDERESDRRRILNYGHTVGHALESLGKYRTLIHGEAVSIGMVQEADIARHLGICSPDVVARQRTLVGRSGLPEALPPITFSHLWSAMQHDKKVAQGRLYCVLPEEVGRVRIIPLERSDIKQWFATRKGNDQRSRELLSHYQQ
jgi:3-dehydroquinate synthase